MRKRRKLVLTVSAALVAVAVLPVDAHCDQARLFATTNYIRNPAVCAGAPCPVGGLSAAAEGFFWGLGGGDAAQGLGNDNGGWPAIENGGSPASSGWISYAADGGGSYIAYAPGLGSATTWAADPRIDGCIDLTGTDPGGFDGTECMVVLVTDTDGAGSSFFAVLTDLADEGGNYSFDTTADVVLAPIPKPRVVGSSRSGPSTIELMIAAPTASSVAAGQHSGNCGSGVVTGYRLYGRSSSVPPVDRNIATGGWTPVSGVIPISSGTTIPGDCTNDTMSLFLAQTLVLDSGYEFNVVSANSTRVNCSPVLTDTSERPRWRPHSGWTPRRGGGRNR